MKAEEIRRADPVDVLIIHEVRLDATESRLNRIDGKLDTATYSSMGTLFAVIGTIIWRLVTNGGHL